MAQNPSISQLDPGQIIKRIYDQADDRIRVDAQVTAIIAGAQEVVITQDDDSIAIGDGSDLFTGTTILTKHGLDVNVISGDITGNVTTREAGLSSFSTSQYTVGTSVQKLTPTPLVGRSSISLRVTADTGEAVFIGNSNTTTIVNGYPLYNGDTLQMDLDDNHEIWAIASSVGQTVYVLEIG